MSFRTCNAILLAGLCAAVPVLGQAPDSPLAERTLDLPRQFPGLLGEDALGLARAPGQWDREDWSRLGLSAAAVLGTALVLDRPLQKAFTRESSPALQTWSHGVEPFGNTYGVLIAGGLYSYGLGAKDGEARAAGADTLASMAMIELALLPLKYGLGRARPNQNLGDASFKPLSGQDSFPSGHTTFAFAGAAAITEHYDSAWVQCLAYGVATLTGLSRMEANAHWASDVLAGLLLGTAIGKSVTRMNQRLRFASQGKIRFRVEPEWSPHAQGLRLSLSF